MAAIISALRASPPTLVAVILAFLLAALGGLWILTGRSYGLKLDSGETHLNLTPPLQPPPPMAVPSAAVMADAQPR